MIGEPGVILSTPVQPGKNIWRYVGKLLRLRLVIAWSSFRRAKPAAKFGTVMLVLLLIGLLAFAFVLSWLLLRFLRSPELAGMLGDLTPFLEKVPALIVTAAFFGILLTSFGVLLQALYLAGDMDFLLSAPIPIRAVFVAKLLQAVLPNFSFMLLFCLPVLYGLGAARGFNLFYFLLTPLVLAVLSLAAAGLSSLLVMVLVRIFPARRVAEVLGFIVATTSLICSQSGQFARYIDVDGRQAAASFERFSVLDAPWSPLAWAGRGLVGLGQGDWLPGLGLLVLSVGLAGGVFFLSLSAAERLYYTGWASIAAVPRKKKARAARLEDERRLPLSAMVERLIPSPVRAVVVKDFLVLRRDLRSLSQLVTPLILGIVYGFMLLRGGGEAPAGRGEAPDWFMEIMRNAIAYGNVAIALFVGWSLLSRLAGMGFSAEGKSFWILKSSPLSPRRLITAKFLVAYLPTLVLGWLFVMLLSLIRGDLTGSVLFSLAVVALSNLGLTGINLAFGVIGANFNWEDPRRMSAGSAGCVGALVSVLYFLVSLALFFAPPVFLPGFGLSEAAGQLIGLVLGGLFCLACAFVPLLLVSGRVARMNE